MEHVVLVGMFRGLFLIDLDAQPRLGREEEGAELRQVQQIFALEAGLAAPDQSIASSRLFSVMA